jgi:prevent-host-death family protein
MRSYSVHEARKRFADVVDRALGGEPQRVTRHGKDAVVIVSEMDWSRRQGAASDDFGAALLKLGKAGAFAEDVLERPDWMTGRKELGRDFG